MAESSAMRRARRHGWAAAALIVTALAWTAPPAQAGGGPRNVLVVANAISEVSRQIAAYYQKARGIPQKNILCISCPTTELVSADICERLIRQPIHKCLSRPDMADIDYIVLTKDVPLCADYGDLSGPYSVASILTCAAVSSLKGPTINPYGPQANLWWNASAPEIYWSSKHDLGGLRLYNVTRLDAFTIDDVKRMIDGSIKSQSSGLFLLDKRTDVSGAYHVANERIGLGVDSAYFKLLIKGANVLADDTSTFVANTQSVVGYFGWASNDPAYSYARYTSHTFVPGSIADGYYSFSARTFVDPRTTSRGSLIADLFSSGLCGAGGYVSEPFVSTATYPDILFDRYAKGYNMAESFFAACPELFWKTVVVGDPLMAPFATPPHVELVLPDAPLTGSAARLGATAYDASGVVKVDFYIGDVLVGTAAGPPYEVFVDTTRFIVGQHTLEAIAYENSPVYTQASARATVQIVNTVSNLERIAQALVYPDGQVVRLTARIVTSATGAAGPGCYIQDPDRSRGILVLGDTPVSEGARVDVLGAVGTVGGERAIVNAKVTLSQTIEVASFPLRPLGMPNSALGVGSAHIGPQRSGNNPGLGNTGLLVRTWGRVTAIESGCYYIDDGSRSRQDCTRPGIKVISTTAPPVGTWVAVTGISGAEYHEDSIVPVVRTRRALDTVIYSGGPDDGDAMPR